MPISPCEQDVQWFAGGHRLPASDIGFHGSIGFGSHGSSHSAALHGFRSSLAERLSSASPTELAGPDSDRRTLGVRRDIGKWGRSLTRLARTPPGVAAGSSQRGGRVKGSSDEPSPIAMSATDSPVTVYWRPGCPYCFLLRFKLRRSGISVREVNIWKDPSNKPQDPGNR